MVYTVEVYRLGKLVGAHDAPLTSHKGAYCSDRDGCAANTPKDRNATVEPMHCVSAVIFTKNRYHDKHCTCNTADMIYAKNLAVRVSRSAFKLFGEDSRVLQFCFFSFVPYPQFTRFLI